MDWRNPPSYVGSFYNGLLEAEKKFLRWKILKIMERKADFRKSRPRVRQRLEAYLSCKNPELHRRRKARKTVQEKNFPTGVEFIGVPGYNKPYFYRFVREIRRLPPIGLVGKNDRLCPSGNNGQVRKNKEDLPCIRI